MRDTALAGGALSAVEEKARLAVARMPRPMPSHAYKDPLARLV